MCGFVGIFNKNTVPTQDLTEAACSIHTRGPDMQGIASGYNFKVAFNRLSIHDLSENGMQPFEYDGVTVYLNGEIYNYIELKAEHENEFIALSGSDVEIIPFLYRKYGLDFLNKLNGMFAIVIIDAVNKVNYLIRDRFAQKPLYYHYVDEQIFFGSEVKAIKKLKKLEVDKTNIKINFSCWFLPQPLTLYKDTFNINPGSFIEYKNGEINEIRWYKPSIKKCMDNVDEIKKNFLKLYKSSIEFRLRSDVPVGIFLSGGLDSTSMAKFANEKSEKDFFAFGAEITGKEKTERNNTDVEIPEKLASDLAFKYQKSILDYEYYNKNIVSIVKHYDEIFMDSGVLVFFELSRLAKKNGVSVVLTGIAGDEQFGGYPWQGGVVRKIEKVFKVLHGSFFYNKKFYHLLIKLNKKIALAYKILFDYKVWHAQSLSDFSFDFGSDRQAIEDRIRSNADKYFQITRTHLYDDLYNRMGYANMFTILGAQNRFSDIAAMKHSVENRSPLLDYRIFEYMMSIPDNKKVKHGKNKGLMRYILKGILPNYVTKAKKSGPTMPLNSWFSDENLLSVIKIFIMNNIDLIEKYLSSDISKKIRQEESWLFSKKSSLKLFAIINFVIWAKHNILYDIDNENITFEELIKKNLS